MSNAKNLFNYGFEYAGKIFVKTTGDVDYEIVEPKFKDRDEQVYAWVIQDIVVYIGMASKGIHKRLSEHRGGWRGGSITGEHKAKLIREQAHQGMVISVYGRKCQGFEQKVSVLGVDKIIRFSLIAQEEAALIEMFQPAWNVVGKIYENCTS